MPHGKFNAFSINPSGAGFILDRLFLDQNDLPGFFQHGMRGNAASDTLRMVIVPTDQTGRILVDDTVWRDILQQMQLDAWVEHLIQIAGNGFHHSGRATSEGGIASYYLATTISFDIWTTRWNPSSGCYTTKYLVLDRRAVNRHFNHPLVTWLLNPIDAFKDESRSALYLPFSLMVNGLRYRESKLVSTLDLVRDVEVRTGHGSWGTAGTFETQGETITKLTARLGNALGALGSTLKHLNMIDDMFAHVEHLSASMAPAAQESKSSSLSPATEHSNASIMEAVSILRQQAAAAREQCKYLESRVKNQSSVLFSFLTHQDSMINLQVANASRDLAEAARRDGSSMKTIAVLTMAFLPATYLATLFSMPFLGWEGSDKFAIYWACVACITIVTFGLWAGITQRQQIRQLISRMRGEERKRRRKEDDVEAITIERMPTLKLQDSSGSV